MTAVPGGTVGKFQIIEGYLPISPNKCMACGSFHGTFIDFGLNDDWYGAVYFCSACVTDMASQLGYCSPVERDKFISKIDEYVEKIKELEKEKNVYTNALAAMDAFMHGSSDARTINATPVEIFSTPVKEQSVSDSKPSRGKQGSPKQNDVGGSASVRDDDSLNQFIETI